jgi:alpha-1,2-mannosyltransferase
MSRTVLRRIGAAAVLLALISWNAWIAHTMVTRLQGGDFRILYLSARAQLEGRDMYDLPSELRTHVGRPLQSTLVNLNPPHFQLLVLPLALLPPGAALALWAGVSLLCLGVSLRVVVRELELEPSAWDCWRGAVWLLAFAGTGAVMGTAEVAFLFMLPLTLGWAAARRGEWTRAGVCLGLAMGVKLFLLIFVPYLLVRRRFGAALASGATAAAWFLGGLLIVGSGTYWSWLSQLASVSWAWRGPNASVLGLLTRSLDENPYYTPLAVAPEVIVPLWLPSVAIIGFCGLAVVMVDRTAAAVDRAFALLLSTALLVSPLGWIYYLWLAAGPAAALALRWRRQQALDQSDPRAAAARWRLRLLMLAVPGLVWPYFATFLFQPHAWATPLLASAYFWSIAALWCALVLDWLAARSQTEHSIRSAGSDPHAGALALRSR